MGYLSLGCMVAYLIWGSLAYVFPKKNMTLWSLLVMMICLLMGHFLHYYPFWVFVALMSVMGFVYGIWLIVKSILLITEIYGSSRSETVVNGAINIAILAGTILGSYLGFMSFSLRWANGFRLLLAIVAVTVFLTMFLRYDRAFISAPFLPTFRVAFPNILAIIKKYIWLFIPIGALWAISTAVGQKMLEIGIDIFDKVPKNSILIIVISIVGAIIGHIVSAFFRDHKKRYAILFTVIFGLTTMYFPYIITRFDYYLTLNISSFVMGLVFGIAVNLLEGRLFYHMGEDHRKEYGSAAYGIVINIVTVVIMLTSDVLTKRIWIIIPFLFFGFILLLMPIFIRKFK